MPQLEDYHYEGSLKDDPKRKLSSLFASFGPRKIGGLVATLVLAIMLPVTLIAMQQQQNTKQQASEVWQQVKILEGNIGKDSNGQYFQPVIVNFADSLHTFVIGEGAVNYKPNAEWFNVYESSTNQPDTDWGGYRNIGGNASEGLATSIVGDQLGLRVRGYDLTAMSATGQYYQTVRNLTSDFPAYPGTWGYATFTNWQSSSTTSYHGVDYKVEVEGGKLKISKRVPDSSAPPTATPRPAGPAATATLAPSNPTCAANAAIRSNECRKSNNLARGATRCSASLGCTRAFYDPESPTNSCGNPKIDTVAYSQDTSCSRVAPGKDDEANTPCYINDDNNPNLLSAAERTALKKFYETNSITNPNYTRTGIATPNAYCGAQNGVTYPTTVPTATPRPQATVVPTSPYVTGAITPVPGAIKDACASTSAKQADRCSANYANSHAYFLTHSKTCTTADMSVAVPLPYPENPKTCYKTDYNCPSTYQGKTLPARNGYLQCPN